MIGHCNEYESGCLDSRASTCGCDCSGCQGAESIRRVIENPPAKPSLPRPNLDGIAFNLAIALAHDLLYADETCFECFSCYKQFGVGYKAPSCTECFGICSSDHTQEIVAELRARGMAA